MIPLSVIFDFDGVIANTMQDNYLAWKDAFTVYGADIAPLDYYKLEGMGRFDIARILSEQYQAGIGHEDEIVIIKEANYKKNNQFSIYPNIPELLQLLTDHGIKIGLVTGASRNRIQSTMPADILPYFQYIVTSDDVVQGKPNPEPYRKAMQELQVEPEACIVVENAILGIESAQAAGSKCFALTTTLDASHLSEADLIFSSHFDLLSHFQKLMTINRSAAT
jgi:beta-phosphoglucomutase